MFELELTTRDTAGGRFVWAEGRGASAWDAMKNLEERLKYEGPREMVGVRLVMTSVPAKDPVPAHVAVVMYGTTPC